MRTSSCILATLADHLALAKDWESPVYSYLYQFEMPISPIKQPLRQFNCPNAPPIDYFEVEIKPFEQQIYPNLGKTRLVGYDGTCFLTPPSPRHCFDLAHHVVAIVVVSAASGTESIMLATEIRQQSQDHLDNR